MIAAWACGVMTVGIVVGVSSTPTAGATSPARSACTAKAVTGPQVLKLSIESTLTGKIPTIPVCVDDEGPFTFLISTGAGSSVIDPSVARSLGLHEDGSSAVRGVTCVPSAATVKVKSWSMSGAKLAPQKLLVAQVTGAGASRAPSGIIGSDVLSRFGGVRIDYRLRRLVLLGEERPGPTGNVFVLGSTRTSPPSALAKGAALKAGAPLRVFESPQGTTVAVPVKVEGRTEQLALDSGSPASGILPGVAVALKLKPGSAKVAVSGVGCSGAVSTFASGAWALGGSSLGVVAPLASRPIAGSLNRGLHGILGSNVLASDGSVIVDYEDAHVWLATG
jgi:hypothetical protein